MVKTNIVANFIEAIADAAKASKIGFLADTP